MTMPKVKRASAVIVVAPSTMLMWDRGFGRTLYEVMAERPAKKKAADDTAPCGRV